MYVLFNATCLFELSFLLKWFTKVTCAVYEDDIVHCWNVAFQLVARVTAFPTWSAVVLVNTRSKVAIHFSQN